MWNSGICMTTQVAQLQDGKTGRIRGRVRSACAEPLTSKLGDQTCVYWDTRPGLDARPDESDSQPFWLEDASGKVLVPAEGVRIEARGEHREALVERATADIHAVTERIRTLKAELRKGDAGKGVSQERRRLAKVATLLCAVRAHAKGNVHASASLKHQEAYIEKNKHLVMADGLGRDTIEMMVQRVEVVLCDGDEVEAEGLFRVEPLPPHVGGAHGYRERAVCMTLRPDHDGDARIVGVGRSAPVEEVDAPVETPRRAIQRHPTPSRDPIVRATAVVVFVIAAAYFLFQ